MGFSFSPWKKRARCSSIIVVLDSRTSLKEMCSLWKALSSSVLVCLLPLLGPHWLAAGLLIVTQTLTESKPTLAALLTYGPASTGYPEHKEQRKYTFKLLSQDIPDQGCVQEESCVYQESPTSPEVLLSRQQLLQQHSMPRCCGVCKGFLTLAALLCRGEFPLTYTKRYLHGRFWNKMEPAWNNALLLAAGYSICSWRLCSSVSAFVLVSLSPWMQKGSCWSYCAVSNSCVNPA